MNNRTFYHIKGASLFYHIFARNYLYFLYSYIYVFTFKHNSTNHMKPERGGGGEFELCVILLDIRRKHDTFDKYLYILIFKDISAFVSNDFLY